MLFKNRREAGKGLAAALSVYKGKKETVVLALPRGGVVVAYEVAIALSLPLDVLVPRKIGAPDNPELAIGAIAGEAIVIDTAMVKTLQISPSYLEREIAKEKEEAKRRTALFRKGKPLPDWSGWTLLLVDDGIATGSTMRASIAALKQIDAKRIVVAVPVGPPDTIEKLKEEVDEVVCLYTPSSFMAVGQFYDHFPQTTDEEVIQLLKQAQDRK